MKIIYYNYLTYHFFIVIFLIILKVSILFGKTLLYIITILLFHRIHLVIIPDIINDRDNIHNYQNQKNNYPGHIQ